LFVIDSAYLPVQTSIMRKLLSVFFLFLSFQTAFSQTILSDSARNFKKDSTLKAVLHADSARIEKEFAEQEKWDHLFATLTYPKIKEAKFGGVLPVTNATEIPDPNQQYKLLFELIKGNNDSAMNEINNSLAEVARVINLHLASGIPAKNIVPVIVVHGPALEAFTTDASYKEKFKSDNPNDKLLDELRATGAKFIACGQAMQFFEVPKEKLQPDVKVSITAQTVLSNYQLKGYVLYKVEPM
jgi:intracellular sulfur oxidation DsrE/DsrF family protein